MPVSPYVLLNHPSLLIFDPRDEIIKFPASLISGLTHSLYHHCHIYKHTTTTTVTSTKDDDDELIMRQERNVREAYRTFMNTITSVIQQEITVINSSSSQQSLGKRFTQVFWSAYIPYIYKTCINESANSIILNTMSPSLKVVLLCLQAEVLGIPLIEMAWSEWNDESQEDFFIAFMTVGFTKEELSFSLSSLQIVMV